MRVVVVLVAALLLTGCVGHVEWTTTYTSTGTATYQSAPASSSEPGQISGSATQSVMKSTSVTKTTKASAATAGECPRIPEPLQDSHGSANTPIQVRLMDGLNGTPVTNQNVLAIMGTTAELDWWVFDFDPFFNHCVVAAAVTDDSGVAVLHLQKGIQYVLAHTEDWGPGPRSYTAEMMDAGLLDVSEFALTVYPKKMRLTWEGDFEAVDLLGTSVKEVRFQAIGEKKSELWKRFGTFSPDSKLTWTNTATSWADLYLGYAATGQSMFTDDFFNDEQGPNSGTVTEDDFGGWIEVSDHFCDLSLDGLDLVVYDPGPAVASTVAPVHFVWVLEYELESLVTPFGHNTVC